MKIERDKYYRLRNGLKALCVYDKKDGECSCVMVSGSSYWAVKAEDGKASAVAYPNDYDVVAPWEDPLDLDRSVLPTWANEYVAVTKDGVWVASAGPISDRDSGGYYAFPSVWIHSDLAPKNFTGDWKDSLHRWDGEKWVRVTGEGEKR